jgi:hypothetical protein
MTPTQQIHPAPPIPAPRPSAPRPAGPIRRPHAGAALAPVLLSILAAAGLAAWGRSSASEPASFTAYGAPVSVGQGSARAYVLHADGGPAEIGVALSEAAFAGLPADGAAGGVRMPDGHHMYVYTLQMPHDNPTPYRFVGLDWSPGGHMPPGIYDRPHFDFHFNSISEAERNAIVPSDPEFEAKAERRPAPELVPSGYQKLPGGVPMMGAHWVDPSSPELNGAPFTRTFLYGSWNGEMIFAEPMVTKAFLETKPDVRAPIATPARYAAPGRYPTAYRVYWNEGTKEYRVALTGLVAVTP